MGASALMKLCASQDDLELGLELFYKMTSLRTTFNRFVHVDACVCAFDHACMTLDNGLER